MFVPDTRLVGDVHLRLILHVNPQLLVINVLLGDRCSQQFLLVMDWLNFRHKCVIESFFLSLERIYPFFFRLLVVSQHVECSITEVFLA